ncbi:glycosyltransferase [Enterococcus casseliflavus]|uniref:glycosyltransferase n=1 Tax=Enterococcus casseliflavus TaxID=37734 RepID=UPI001AD6B452|nr:glycosyltransferase [Enterococcus casseliflavus]MBO6383967.1 glycosyltransferase [Enterococcus casseliflavus]
MKVCIIAPFLSGYGGTETVIKSLLDNVDLFETKQIELDLFLPQGSKDCSWISSYSKNVTVGNTVNFNSPARKISGFINMVKFLTNSRYDIVICMSDKIIGICDLINKMNKNKFKIVSWIHFSLFDSHGIKIKEILKADYHLAISNGISNQLILNKVPKEKISVIGNPVKKNSNTINRSDDNILRLIYVGRIYLNGQKNLQELFETLELLETNKWQLDIFGEGPDSEIVEKLVGESEISSQVNFHGWVNNPLSKVKTADFLILTSRYEGFPMVILEANSLGLPCISSNCPTGPSDLIQSGKNGFLYEMGNKFELADIINGIIKGNYLIATEKSIKESIENYYISNYIDKLSAVLLNI